MIHRESRYLLVFLLVVHSLFLMAALHYGGYLIPDSFDYLFQKSNFQQYGSFYAWDWQAAVKMDYFTKRTPGYAIFLLLFSNHTAILLAQNIIGICTWMLVYNMLSTLVQDRLKAARITAVGLLLQTNYLIYTNTIISETLFAFLLVLGMKCFFDWYYHRKRLAFIPSQLALCVALLVKPVLLFFFAFNSLFVLVLAFRYKRYLMLLWLFPLPLIVLLLSLRNEKLTGYRHFSSITTVNLKDYNTRMMLESKYGYEEADKLITAINTEAEKKQNYKERNEFIRDTCSKLIKENWWTYSKLHAKGMLAMLADPGRYDYVNFFNAEGEETGFMGALSSGDFDAVREVIARQNPWLTGILIFNLCCNGTIVLLALFSFTQWKRYGFVFLCLLGLILYFWVLTGPVGTARYRSAIYPFLLMLATMGLAAMRNWDFPQKEWKG